MVRFLIPLTVLLLSILLVSCGGSTPSSTPASTPASTTSAATVPVSSTTTISATQPRYGGTLRIGNNTEPAFLGAPYNTRSTPGLLVSKPSLEQLTRNDNDYNITPWMVTDWKLDSVAKTYTFTVRKGVKFQDGTDWNAQALKWNFDMNMTEKAMSVDIWDSVQVIDDYTVSLKLKTWDNTILGNLTGNNGCFVSPAAYNQLGKDKAEATPTGTGAFKFVDWIKDKVVTYKKSDSYWEKGRPYLDAIEISNITDSTTRLFSLRSGQIDAAVGLDLKDWASLEKDGFRIARQYAAVPSNLISDSANPNSPWSNLKVRQAAQYAIDQDALVQACLNGEGGSINQMAPPGHWGYSPDVKGYPYNIAKAKQLMTEAGYPDGFKTKITFQTSSLNNLVYTAVQEMLRKIGIEVTLNPMQTVNQIFIGGTWDGLMQGVGGARVDVTAILRQNLAQPTAYYISMAHPDDMVKTISDALIAPDQNTKAQLTRDWQKLFTDKYCLGLILFAPKTATVYQPYVHNCGLNEIPGASIWWTPEECWLGTEKPVSK
jgi:peptide/nickel transport system substrate-binding protein